ncbi:MFS transporter [Rhizobium paknamense]|uniref:MFS family arabinose efflux permease n=1 Tax=Rhizobium paknamense TaxID=1206817 RepID=A0ABU0IBQ5_9HYPH|nr:MFS transporter [Rhizobium paknamense]MDQ0455668.1 putative MFS family arabinose efflux permease [Rhizobium paknamense]
MSKLNSFTGHAALSVCHMAGMIDLAALPLWIGTLMKFYGLGAPQAGLTVTAFLAAAVASSSVFAPMFTRLPHRLFAAGGFALATVAFFVASRLPASADSFSFLLILHAVAGMGAGGALSVTHGSIGRTSNPHRLFGIVNVAMGLLAIVMFAVLPGAVAAAGGSVLFLAFALTMGFAALVSLLFFPSVEKSAAGDASHAPRALSAEPLSGIAWLIIGAIVCLALAQATVFSFVERIGDARGFSGDTVQFVLVVMGFINLIPGALAALLQKRLPPLGVGLAGPVLQTVLAMCITHATVFPVYAAPAMAYVSVVIFTHTFLFGFLSKVDRTGRAVAATPAMMMSGSAIGPALGGVIVANVGYGGLGWAVFAIATLAVTFLAIARRKLARDALRPVLATA